MDEKLEELKLYSPITAEFVENEMDSESDLGYMDIEDYAQHLDGRDLVDFRDTIEEAIADEVLSEEAERGLMTWFRGSESVNNKVHSIWIAVEEKNDRLYGVAVCQLKEKLNSEELLELKEFCTGQYADGWGEGFEQRERRCADGELYVHFWQPDKFFICTEQEMAQNRRLQQNKTIQNIKGGGEAR